MTAIAVAVVALGAAAGHDAAYADPDGTSAAVSPAGATAAPRWVIRDLGTLGGPSSVAVGVNQFGWIVGTADTPKKDSDGDPIGHAFLWRDGQMLDLGTLGGKESEATDIDAQGRVVGSAETKLKDASGDGVSHAFLWEDGAMQDLGSLGRRARASEAYQINGRRQVVGAADVQVAGTANDPPYYHAFLWEDGRMRDLGTLKGGLSEAVAINDQGQIVGTGRIGYLVGTFYETEAFLWAKGRMRSLGTLGGPYSKASDINERGQIVGSAQPAKSTHYEDPVVAFLWHRGRMRGLGTLGGPSSDAQAINGRGWVVGRADTAKRDMRGDPISHAFLWRNGRMLDLRRVALAPGFGGAFTIDLNQRGWVAGTEETTRRDKNGDPISRAYVWLNGKSIQLATLGRASTSAEAINDNGQVVGWATTTSGERHAVIWEPRP